MKTKEQMTHINNANHAHFIALRRTTGALGDEVRLGEAKGAFGFNIVPKDGLFPPDQVATIGPKIDGNVWHCYEVAFLNSGANSQLKVWLDDANEPVLFVEDGTDMHVPEDLNFLDGRFNELALGWHSFSGNPSSQAVWIDDLVISTDRIGCY